MTDQPKSRSEREINPCPFCSATWQSGLLGVDYLGQPARGWNVSCMRCKATGPYVDGGSTESIPLAIDAWNKAPVSERGTPINQCDGCQRGLPVVNGKHDLTGTAGSYPGEVMACTKDRYVDHKFIEAIRVGCNAAEVHLTCSYPACSCKQIPAAIRAVLSERNSGT